MNRNVKHSAMRLPVNYNKLSTGSRKLVRMEYIRRQKSCCWYCKGVLFESPPKTVLNKVLDMRAFPPHFLDYPVHLHHDHDTGMTIGAVHAYCNGVLWQYHDE